LTYKSSTLDDLEGSLRTLLCQYRVGRDVEPYSLIFFPRPEVRRRPSDIDGAIGPH